MRGVRPVRVKLCASMEETLYLQHNIDQAAVRLALLVVVLTPAPTGRCGVTTALVLRSRMSAKACPELVEGSHLRF